MKKYMSKILALTMSLCVLSGAMINVNAEEISMVSPHPTPVVVEFEETTIPSNKNISPSGVKPIDEKILNELVKADYEKYLKEKDKISKILIPQTRAYWQAEGNDAYQYIAQSTNYECGVASTMMTLVNINGTTPSRTDVIAGIGTTTAGTDMTPISQYLNQQQSRLTYATQWYKNIDLMKSHLWSSLTNGGSAVMNVSLSTSAGWYYNTSGHYFTVYSMLSDYSKVAIADPWGGYIGESSWRWYDKNSDTLYNALKHGYIWGS